MITARRTRLVRVPDLHEFRRVIEAALHVAAPLVLVPTQTAGRQLKKLLGEGAAELVTRDQMYDALHARLSTPPKCLTPFERDAVLQASAVEAARRVPGLSFHLRPGLVAEMLRFYDQLRRQSQQVDRFEQLIVDMLGGESATGDRGSERLLLQTRFLAHAFREYERRLLACDACDEHSLRTRLIAEPGVPPIQHIIVTVSDWIADPDGLFAADFDLLSRMPGLEALDIVTTEATLGSGFDERLHDWWPGLEEVSGSSLPGSTARVRPTLLTPKDALPDQVWFTHRDREEELLAVARRVRGGLAGSETAIVFKHPLPYLYLASETLGAYEASDALPLAAEPTAAAVDLVIELAETNFVRSAIVALLRSPHFGFCAASDSGGRPTCEEGGTRPICSREAIKALDVGLSDARYLGEIARLEELITEWATERRKAAMPALRMAASVCRELAPLREPRPASQQLELLQGFFAQHLRQLDEHDRFASRERRGRAIVSELLTALAGAHRAHHDPVWTIDDLSAAVRRWIGEETFVPETPGGGVCLLDDQAARYGTFDHVAIVGLVEHEWPDRPRPNIFYPTRMLRSLGWPSERDRRGAADARFLDLVASASRTVTVSTFLLDEDAPVTRSVQLDEIARAGLSAVTMSDDSREAAVEASPPPDSPAFHGNIGPLPARAWSVSALEKYLECPFKFYALHLLKLEEEPDDEEVMDPRRQGQFVHEVFESFFKTWQATGQGAITAGNLDDARAMFEEVVDRALQRLPHAEAGLERTRLLGSPAAAGLGEAVFRMEAERPAAVVERLLEYRLDGLFTICASTAGAEQRVVSLRGKADRLDLLEDGTFRLIDYKLGWPPNRARALQLPIYGVCAEQQLASRHGRTWTLGEAAYLAFKGPKRVVPLFSSAADRDKALGEAQARLADTIDAIERGEFPPSPDDVYRCDSCRAAAVCRKDYVGDVRT